MPTRSEIQALAPDTIEHSYGNHDLCDPDTCFAAKCRYWRENGGLNTHIPSWWRGESWMSQEKKVVAEAQAAGYEPERVR